MAVAAPAHALCEVVPPQSSAETSAAILAAPVAVEQYLWRPATPLLSHVSHLDYHVGVGLG